MNEVQKLSLETGEFIHTIANRLVKGSIIIKGVDGLRASLIMELSEALRCSNPLNTDTPTLTSEGFFISDYPRSIWVDLASRLIDANEDTPTSVIVERVKAAHAA